MSTIGLFGGTFNPVHKGHINALEIFIKEAHIDIPIVMPTCIPPHKQYSMLVTNEDRLNMLKLSVSNISTISDYEISKGGKSYTIDTIEYLSKIYPKENITLFVGSDMLLSMDHAWYRIEDILKKCTVFVMSRTGNDLNVLRESSQSLEKKFNAKIIISNSTPIPMASTDIRTALKTRSDLSKFLTPEVIEYIQKRKLYL